MECLLWRFERCSPGRSKDVDAVVYLMLASELVKSISPNAVMIAEDVSGMPGLCVPVAEGALRGGR